MIKRSVRPTKDNFCDIDIIGLSSTGYEKFKIKVIEDILKCKCKGLHLYKLEKDQIMELINAFTNTSLNYLDLEKCKIPIEYIINILNNYNINYLYLDSCECINDEAIEQLADVLYGNTNLISLQINNEEKQIKSYDTVLDIIRYSHIINFSSDCIDILDEELHKLLNINPQERANPIKSNTKSAAKINII